MRSASQWSFWFVAFCSCCWMMFPVMMVAFSPEPALFWQARRRSSTAEYYASLLGTPSLRNVHYASTNPPTTTTTDSTTTADDDHDCAGSSLSSSSSSLSSPLLVATNTSSAVSQSMVLEAMEDLYPSHGLDQRIATSRRDGICVRGV
jgi:hypothetical protein